MVLLISGAFERQTWLSHLKGNFHLSALSTECRASAVLTSCQHISVFCIEFQRHALMLACYLASSGHRYLRTTVLHMQRWHLFRELACLAYMENLFFKLSGLLPAYVALLNMCSSVYTTGPNYKFQLDPWTSHHDDVRDLRKVLQIMKLHRSKNPDRQTHYCTCLWFQA